MKRKKRPGRKGKKGIYIVPNLLTSASLFGGFYAIMAAVEGRFEAAATAILMACLFDALDGKVARLTNSSSPFGTEYDSLSDLVSFGVAPALLAYRSGLDPFGRLGMLASFTFVICGALRLARFNVQKGTVQPGYFRGLPIPGAAGMVASLILFEEAVGGLPEFRGVLFLVLLGVLSFLMVSTILYPSFKEVDLRRRKPFNMLVAFILVGVVITYQPKVMLMAVMLGYVLSGPALALYYQWKTSVAGRETEIIAPRDVIEGVEEAADRGTRFTCL